MQHARQPVAQSLSANKLFAHFGRVPSLNLIVIGGNNRFPCWESISRPPRSQPQPHVPWSFRRRTFLGAWCGGVEHVQMAWSCFANRVLSEHDARAT